MAMFQNSTFFTSNVKSQLSVFFVIAYTKFLYKSKCLNTGMLAGKVRYINLKMYTIPYTINLKEKETRLHIHI